MADGREPGRAITVRERRWPAYGTWPEELERFFDRAMGGFFWPRRRFRRAWPALWREAACMADMDIFERDGKTVVRVDLPGMTREDIEVAVEGDMLVIRGHREAEREIKEEDYYCCERETGEFARAVSLPEGATPESIEATYEKGVLEVTIPQPERKETQAVKVAVKER